MTRSMAALRDCFHRHHGLQCGFCTPAMLITARDLIRRGRAGSEREIRAGLAGNICRCTGYTNIVAAIAEAAAALAGRASDARMTPGESAPRCCAARTSATRMGRGEFVSDIKLPGTMEVAFLRSPHAHARIRGITAPPEGKGRVFTAADLPRIQPIRVVTQAAGAKAPAWPPLATDKARYVGEAIAACIAPSPRRGRRPRRRGRRSISRCSTPSSTRRATCAAAATRFTSSWGDNLYSERVFEGGDIDAAARAAEITVTREYRMHRQSGAPLEGRAVLAYRDHRLDEVVVYASTQTPHTVRVALGEFLGVELRRIRVVAPDVGGGFGPKARLYPEEIILAALALELDHPVRWVEDRGEHLLTSAHTRDHHYKVTAYADRQGRILGVDAEIVVDAGAYGLWPQGPYQEAGDGGAQPAGALRDPELSRARRHRRDQQGAARPLSRGRPAGRVLCDRADDRRGRPCGRPRPGRGAGAEHGAARADAVHHDRRHALRQWRLSAQRAGYAPNCWTCRRFARGSSRARRTAG